MPKSEEDEIWTVYAQGVKPLKRIKADQHLPVSPVSNATSRAVREKPTVKLKDNKNKSSLVAADFKTPLDHNIERRLRQGAMAIEARLDLHGMHQIEAHKALSGFIAAQIKAGRRCLLIITGKGRGGEGVLRASLAGWIAGLPGAAQILALRPAAIKHGGNGAFYVLLRRQRD